jgi:hypothetical protein
LGVSGFRSVESERKGAAADDNTHGGSAHGGAAPPDGSGHLEHLHRSNLLTTVSVVVLGLQRFAVTIGSEDVDITAENRPKCRSGRPMRQRARTGAL